MGDVKKESNRRQHLWVRSGRGADGRGGAARAPPKLRPLAAALGEVDDFLGRMPRRVAGTLVALPPRPDAGVEPGEQEERERGDHERNERVAPALGEIG